MATSLASAITHYYIRQRDIPDFICSVKISTDAPSWNDFGIERVFLCHFQKVAGKLSDHTL